MEENTCFFLWVALRSQVREWEASVAWRKWVVFQNTERFPEHPLLWHFATIKNFIEANESNLRRKFSLNKVITRSIKDTIFIKILLDISLCYRGTCTSPFCLRSPSHYYYLNINIYSVYWWTAHNDFVLNTFIFKELFVCFFLSNGLCSHLF